jgi:hypothetical protein
MNLDHPQYPLCKSMSSVKNSGISRSIPWHVSGIWSRSKTNLAVFEGLSTSEVYVKLYEMLKIGSFRKFLYVTMIKRWGGWIALCTSFAVQQR